MKPLIIPSIIASSQKELDRRIKKVSPFAKRMQLDFMDGKFVKNKTFDFDFKLPKKIFFEAHIMHKDPRLWIENNHKKVNMIIFHIESIKRPLEMIRLIRSKKKKVGMAISPRTPLSKIIPYVKFVDQVTVMSVYPGRYGSKFLPFTMKNVSELRKLYPRIIIEVDGGINNKTITQARDAGANFFISGSYLQNSRDVKRAFDDLKNKVHPSRD